MNERVIDFKDGFTFSHEKSPTLNAQPLFMIPHGLFMLANGLRIDELNYKAKGVAGCLLLSDSPQASWITCKFDWFSISLVSFLKLIGTLKYLSSNNLKDTAMKDRKHAQRAGKFSNDFVQDICPEVLIWRNKVSAHHAFSAPRSSDKLSDLRQTITANIGFHTDRFYSCAARYGSVAGTSDLPSWSLTKVYEDLLPRFWPHLPYNIEKVKKKQ